MNSVLISAICSRKVWKTRTPNPIQCGSAGFVDSVHKVNSRERERNDPDSC